MTHFVIGRLRASDSYDSMRDHSLNTASGFGKREERLRPRAIHSSLAVGAVM